MARAPWLAVALLASVVAAPPPVARADDSSTVTIVGTSDVVDSDLVSVVLKPGFEAAYPKYTLNYVSQGTGAAIATAEAGAASGLLVHAASLENQFVAQGYSDEQYGRAIFYGDYVLLGPAADPAGVLTAAPHDIATAFERIAAAGAQGNANYVSRGGTPGTTVEEHAIWQLTSGVTTCQVDDADGGGRSPSTTAGACPDSISYPDWYHATGLTQAPNVENADVCNYNGGNCYVLTDRGTFDYLESTHAISQLRIATQHDTADARGGTTLLVNSFHAYALNPAKFAGDGNVHINLAGAEAFLNWVTSPAGQRAVADYRPNGSSAPFRPDSAPRLTAHAPHHVKAGHRLTVRGRLRNLVPGTPPLAGVQIMLEAKRQGHKARAVATTTTGAAGRYRLHDDPKRKASYTVSSAAISQVEIPCRKNGTGLCPEFGDLLASASRTVGAIRLTGAVHLDQPTERGGAVLLTGTLRPRVQGTSARLRADAATSRHASLHVVKRTRLQPGAARFRTTTPLRPGHRWTIRVTYLNPGKISPARSRPRTLVV